MNINLTILGSSDLNKNVFFAVSPNFILRLFGTIISYPSLDIGHESFCGGSQFIENYNQCANFWTIIFEGSEKMFAVYKMLCWVIWQLE